VKRPELLVEGGNLAGRRFAVPPGGLRLGRSSSNDIAPHDSELSRNHCLFETVGESGLRVTDLASANGTFVNGRRLGAEGADLKLGDVIRVGTSHLTVVGEGAEAPKAPSVDLGLGTLARSSRPASAEAATPKPRSPLMKVLWGVAILAMVLAVVLIIQMPTEPSARAEEVASPKSELVSLYYEKIVADSRNIFRYELSCDADRQLRVVIDDVPGGGPEGRHVNNRVSLGDRACARLMEILADGGFAGIPAESRGPDEEPPRLNSFVLQFDIGASCKSISIVNAPESDAFRRLREKLEMFAMNELGIRALQYSRDDLLKMAHAAAETAQMKWDDREVEHGNIHAAICAWREAIADLETVNPKPPEYEGYVAARIRAEEELDKRYRNQRFAAEQATSTGDWERARAELRTLCEMIPDREDDRYREASVRLMDVEKRLERKGGR